MLNFLKPLVDSAKQYTLKVGNYKGDFFVNPDRTFFNLEGPDNVTVVAAGGRIAFYSERDGKLSPQAVTEYTRANPLMGITVSQGVMLESERHEDLIKGGDLSVIMSVGIADDEFDHQERQMALLVN